MPDKRAIEDSERLLNLKQTGTTREYAIDFRTIASRLGWNDAALKAIFYQGLHHKVKAIIRFEEQPNTLEEYIQRAQILDERISLLEQEKRGGFLGRKDQRRD